MSTPLHNACFGGHADIVALLIEKGAEVSAVDSDKETPLHKAAWAGSEQIMALLLDKGAKVDAKAVDGSTALHKAAYGGHLPCLFLLLECGAKINRQDAEGGTALHNAVYNGHVGCVDYLIKKGADINVLDGRGAAVLHYAAFFGQRRITNLLLRKGATVGVVDQVGRTPLHLAAFKGNTFGMLLFLMAKAEVGCATDKGMTPMSFAAYSGNFASVMLLDQHGAQAKQKDEKGLTPLHLAALRGKSDVCAFLILKDAKLNARDDSGRTPLHYAARANNADVVSLLLENGAKLDVLDKNGKTAEQLAAERGDKCAAVNQFFHTILEDGKKYKEASYAEKINFLIPEVRRGRMSDFDRMNWLETDLDFGMGGAGAGGAGGAARGGVQINIDTSKRGKNAYVYEPLGIDINSAAELAACVEAHARTIGVVSGWMNILRHLIVVPYARVEVAQFMWKIIELFVHRVVVQKEDDDWENDRVRLDLETFERLHQDEPPLSEDETMALLKSVLEALQVLFPGLEVPTGEDDGADFKQRTEEEEEQIKLKREKRLKAANAADAKSSEARAARSVDEKLAHLLSDEDDFLPSAGGGGGDDAAIVSPTGGPPPPPGAPMPPPPPGMAKKLGPKLRRFNWIKIPVPKIPNTIFKDMDPDKCFLDIEKKYLEGAYYVKEAKKLGEKGKFNQVNIVDLKRAQTIGILLARIKQPIPAIAEAVLSLDEKVLTLDDVRSLAKFSPTKDEIDSLKKYIEAGSDVSKLGQAEHFFLELMRIENLAGRLSAWVFKREFDFKLADILADIEMVNNAVVELKKSAKFTKLLHVTLVLGNYMNGGYFGGAGKGYKLQSLLRLRDTKTADNKSNLLEHLIHLFEKNDQEKGTTLMEWRDDMPNVFNGTKERLDLVASNVEELKASVAELENTLKAEKDEQFIAKLSEFTSKTGDRMQMIIDSATKVRQRFETTAAYYGEDDPNDDFITFLGQFHNEWTAQIKTLQEKREKEEARQKKKRAFMPKAKRQAMAGGTDTKFKRQMEEDDGLLFKAGDGDDDDGAIGGGGGGGGGGAAGPRSMLKSKRNLTSASGTETRAKPKVVAVQAYNSDDDSEDSISFEGPLVGVKVATTLATAGGDDDDDEVD
jgi:ankyrin repeat protein